MTGMGMMAAELFFGSLLVAVLGFVIIQIIAKLNEAKRAEEIGVDLEEDADMISRMTNNLNRMALRIEVLETIYNDINDKGRNRS